MINFPAGFNINTLIADFYTVSAPFVGICAAIAVAMVIKKALGR